MALPRNLGVNVSVDASELAGVRDAWRRAGKQMPLAMSRALNKVGPLAMTQVRRRVAKEMGVKYSAVMTGIQGYKAAPQRLEYDVTGRGSYMTLRQFDPYPLARRRGVSARPWGTRQWFRGAFIIPSLNNQVFKRTGKARGDIKVLYGPAIPREMLRGEVPGIFQAKAATEMLPKLNHEIMRLLPGGRPRR